MSWIPGLCGSRQRQQNGCLPEMVEVLDVRALLADGISPAPGPPINAVAGVPITKAVVATFTITDSTGSPGTKWNSKITWGDGTAPDKNVAATAGPNGSFQF